MKDKRWNRWLIPSAAMLLGFGCGPAHGTTTADVGWQAVAASGKVEMRIAAPEASAESWDRVRRGDVLPAKSEVRTGRSGRATFVQESGLLIVDPGTELELPEHVMVNQPTTINQNSGSVIYEVTGRATRDFSVVTPFLVAGVKGTTFVVTVEEDRAVVTVREGVVEVTDLDTGAVFDVREGQMMVGGDAEYKPRPMSIHAKDAESKGERKNTLRLARSYDSIDRKVKRAVRDASEVRGDGEFDIRPSSKADGTPVRTLGVPGNALVDLGDVDHVRTGTQIAQPATASGAGSAVDGTASDWSSAVDNDQQQEQQDGNKDRGRSADAPGHTGVIPGNGGGTGGGSGGGGGGGGGPGIGGGGGGTTGLNDNTNGGLSNPSADGGSGGNTP